MALIAPLPVLLSPRGSSPPTPFAHGRRDAELREGRDDDPTPLASPAAAAPPGITGGGAGGTAVGAAAAGGTRALPFCLAIASVFFVIVVLGLITVAARYYACTYLRRRAARNASSGDARAAGADAQAPAGLDAERVAAFPVWSYCLFPAAARDFPAGEPRVGSGEKDAPRVNPAAVTASETALVADGATLLGTSERQITEFLQEGRPLTSTECTVCLSDFCEGELIRSVLPCEHRFHVACIDLWLATHTTCPVCRADLKSSAPRMAVDDSDVREVDGGDDAV
ncbi:hypothetical protein CLOM_g10534 [Closterium sp. NIES-68]|nr:hypothetical protein CLOM_g10534 [Closterium sp. NIES-68]GJP59084.1 hypothetical protein CLOP_g7162 [Closterium sp. NIES-67]